MLEKNLLFSVCPDDFKKDIVETLRNDIILILQKHQTKESDEYLTRKEVAELLKCDLSTIHNWTKKGKLTKYGIGDRTYYKKSDIEKAIVKITS